MALHHDMLKPREIREALRGKIDPAVGTILVRLCEDSRQTRMQLAEVMKLLNQWADTLNAMMHITERMKAEYEKQFGPMKPPGTSIEDAIKSLGAPEAANE